MRAQFAIIGAGPAGLSAAEVASEAGISTIIIDENERAGGQFLRQPPLQFIVSDWAPGASYGRAKRLLYRVAGRPDLQWLLSSTVSGVWRREAFDREGTAGFVLSALHRDSVCEIEADAVLVATGCYESAVPFPGATLAGVMTAGAVQQFLKSQRILPGQKILFVGTHPLQLVAADQVLRAGGHIAGVVFAQRFSQVASLLTNPRAAAAGLSKLVEAGAAMLRLRRAQVPILFGTTLLRAEGTKDGVDRVILATVGRNGRTCESVDLQSISCDCLAISFGFESLNELACFCGAKRHWNSKLHSWIVDHDEWMSTAIPGLFVAGEVAGIGGAEVAMTEGALAAHAVTRLHGHAVQHPVVRKLRRRRARQRSFAALLQELSFSAPELLDSISSDQAVLCRCEEYTIADLRGVLDRYPHITTANAVKQVTRIGMGLCQGRYCYSGMARILAAVRSESMERIGTFTPAFPCKPVEISALLGNCEMDSLKINVT